MLDTRLAPPRPLAFRTADARPDGAPRLGHHRARALARLSLCALLACACRATSNDEPSTPARTGTGAPLSRVAACQIEVDGDREAAFARIDAALTEAAAQGAQLACFPEACLFGWVNPLAHEAADPIPGPTIARLGELARRHDLMLVIGLAVRDEDGLHNAAVLIDRDGRLLLRHDKVNVLGELMTPGYRPGDEARASVVETSVGRIGLLICADTFREDLVARLADARPDLVLVPYGWAAPAGDWPQHGASLHAWIANTARVTGAPTLGVDSTGALGHGPWKGFVLGGQSAFSTADGRLAPVLADRRPEVRVFEWTADSPLDAQAAPTDALEGL